MNAAHLLKSELKRFLPWHQARIDCLARLILAMIQVRSVNLTQLAVAFDVAVQQESVYQRVKRFFRHHVFETDRVALLVTNWLDLGEKWLLCLDRTNWQLGKTPINILMLSVAYGGVSVPLMWTVLNKKGMSSTDERVELLERFLTYFPRQRIDCLTADREFRGQRWITYLLRQKIPFRIRIPNNTQTHNRHHNRGLPVTRLFSVRIGETMILNRPRRLWGLRLYLAGTRALGGEHVIVVTAHAPQQALTDYRRRWETECLFAAMKSRGFNLEQTHLTDPARVERLLAVMALAICWCYKIGLWENTRKPIPYKSHQRRAHSIIRRGLDTLRRVLLNTATQINQLCDWIHFLFHEKSTTVTS